MKYYQVTDGEWVDVRRKHSHACCDCGLTHDIEIRVKKNGHIDIKYTTNRRATAAARKAFKFEREED